MQPWVILQFTILLLVANGTHIVVKDLLGDRLSHPLDGFLKRRLDPPTGSRAIGLDQIPESLFPLLACAKALSLTVRDIVLTVAIFCAGEVVLSRLLSRFKLRDRPY